MTAYTIPADLRPWVERTAPTLTVERRPCPLGVAVGHGIQPGCFYCSGTGYVDDWREVEACAASHWNANREPRWTVSEARALLAYLDEAARGLTGAQSTMLAIYAAGGDGHGGRGSNWTIRALLRRGLLGGKAWPGYRATGWGRVIAERARVLREDGGDRG